MVKRTRAALFYIFVIFNASIVFSFEYFPTLDSGAHAYNSNILYELIFGSYFKDFYSLNPEFVPNLTAHVVMAIFNSFLPFNMAEKMTLFIYFISFPFLFKALLSKFNRSDSWFIFLVFPFTHFATLYLGFYNFAYGVLFFLLGVVYWIGNREDFRVKHIIVFLIISLLSYCSHLVSFIAMVMFCAAYEIFDIFLKISQFRLKSMLKCLLKEKMILFVKCIVAFALPLFFTYKYFAARPDLGRNVFFEANELNTMLLEGDIFQSFGAGEKIITKPLVYLIIALVLYAFISKIFHFLSSKRDMWIQHSDIFLLFAGLFFYFFYTQPDSDGYGGYISIRLALFANLLVVIWASITIKEDVKIEFLSFLLATFLTYRLVDGKKESVGWLSSQLSNFKGVNEHLSDGDLVASVFLANYNWLGNHFSNYLGAEKKVVVLDNYEASTGYFPAVWKYPNSEVVLREPNSADDVHEFKRKVMNFSMGNIKFILVYGSRNDNDLCKLLIEEIEKDFTLDWNQKDVFLYKKKI